MASSFAQQAFGLGVDGDEFFAAVAHLHHRHARAVPVEHLFGGLAQHAFGQRGRAGAEVVDALHRVFSKLGSVVASEALPAIIPARAGYHFCPTNVNARLP